MSPESVHVDNQPGYANSRAFFSEQVCLYLVVCALDRPHKSATMQAEKPGEGKDKLEIVTLDHSAKEALVGGIEEMAKEQNNNMMLEAMDKAITLQEEKDKENESSELPMLCTQLSQEIVVKKPPKKPTMSKYLPMPKPAPKPVSSYSVPSWAAS